MGEIKSAREIALEKIARLGSLSPEEIRKQQEEKRRGVVDLLLSRYLGGLSLAQLEVEIGKTGPADQPVLRKMLASRVLDELDLEAPDRRQKAVDAIRALVAGDTVADLLAEVDGLFAEWEGIVKSRSADMERAARATLHRMRIGGSAIAGINVRGNPVWRESLHTLAAPCESRLTELKRKVTALLS